MHWMMSPACLSTRVWVGGWVGGWVEGLQKSNLDGLSAMFDLLGTLPC